MKIETHDLIKRYGSRTVVDHVNVEVEQGSIVGLLGPNGAGKTTTFYMIVGIIQPDEGVVWVWDAFAQEVRSDDRFGLFAHQSLDELRPDFTFDGKSSDDARCFL